MVKFELVVPAYNEAENLPLLINKAVDAAKKENLSPEEFQFIIVNNGSHDHSKEILTQLKNQNCAQWFKVVDIPVNQGYGYGVLQGLKSTEAPIIGWSHADMQCDPTDAIKAFKLVYQLSLADKNRTESRFFIKGVRTGRDWKDQIVSRVFEILSRFILGLKVYEMNAQPKVFNRNLLTSLKNPPLTFAFDMYVLYHAQKNNYLIKTIPVLFPPRIHGVSNWASNFISRYKTIIGIIRYMIDLRKKEGSL